MAKAIVTLLEYVTNQASAASRVTVVPVRAFDTGH